MLIHTHQHDPVAHDSIPVQARCRGGIQRRDAQACVPDLDGVSRRDAHLMKH